MVRSCFLALMILAPAATCLGVEPDAAALPRMHFADTVSGRPFSKDPAVVKFNGRYWLYYWALHNQ